MYSSMKVLLWRLWQMSSDCNCIFSIMGILVSILQEENTSRSFQARAITVPRNPPDESQELNRRAGTLQFDYLCHQTPMCLHIEDWSACWGTKNGLHHQMWLGGRLLSFFLLELSREACVSATSPSAKILLMVLSDFVGHRIRSIGLTKTIPVPGAIQSGKSAATKEELGVWPVHGIYFRL